jgi:hypothetical protein
MQVRFVKGTDVVSRLIAARQGEAYPFVPTHCELALVDGYLGAHFKGGVQLRSREYDKGTFSHELFVDVPCDTEKAESYARSKIGTPYAWSVLVDYLVPLYVKAPNYLICSSLTVDTLTVGGAFKSRLAVPSGSVSPRTLLVVLSAIVSIPLSGATHGPQTSDGS